MGPKHVHFIQWDVVRSLGRMEYGYAWKAAASARLRAIDVTLKIRGARECLEPNI